MIIAEKRIVCESKNRDSCFIIDEVFVLGDQVVLCRREVSVLEPDGHWIHVSLYEVEVVIAEQVSLHLDFEHTERVCVGYPVPLSMKVLQKFKILLVRVGLFLVFDQTQTDDARLQIDAYMFFEYLIVDEDDCCRVHSEGVHLGAVDCVVCVVADHGRQEAGLVV